MSGWVFLENQWIDETYCLVDFLGVGGDERRAVFRATQSARGIDMHLDDVAVKLFDVSGDVPDKEREQFLSELRAAVGWKHEALLPASFAGAWTITSGKREHHYLYLVMSLARESLRDRLKRGTMSQEEVREVIHVAGFNLGLLMRKKFGLGTPKGMADRLFLLLLAISDDQTTLIIVLAVVPGVSVVPWAVVRTRVRGSSSTGCYVVLDVSTYLSWLATLPNLSVVAKRSQR